jgi:hypothetical protein
MATQTIAALPTNEDTTPPSAPHLIEGSGPARLRGWLAAAPRIGVSRAWLAAVPVVSVNAVSFAAQLAFLRAHLPWPLPGQALVAVTLESVAVYLAAHAHLAQLANDTALRLRLAAYGFAAVIGAMNYSHYMAPGWRPTFAALAFGLCSVSSPWLWSVHSRRESRDALMSRGLIEPHAVRLGATRWLWHPIRSTQVMWHATWEGVNEVRRALALADAAELPPIELDAVVLDGLSSRERLFVAFGAVGGLDVPKALAMLKSRGAPVDQSTAYQIRKAIASAPARPDDSEPSS